METSELAPDAPRTQTDPSPSIQPDTADALAPHDAPDNTWAPDEGRCVSLEEYWDRWYENPYPDIDVSYEWNNGRLEAKPLPNAPNSTSITGSSPFCSAMSRPFNTQPCSTWRPALS